MAEDENVDPRELIVKSVPTAPVSTQWFYDLVSGTTQDGEQFVRVVVSFATPVGVSRYWFEPDALARFCTTGIDIVKEARAERDKKKLVVAKGLPKDDGNAEAAKRAAEEVVRQMGLKKER